MDAGDAAGKLFHPFGGIAAAGLDPEGVESEAQLVGRGLLAQPPEDGPALDFLEFLVVVVHHKELSMLLEDPHGFAVGGQEGLGGVLLVMPVPAEADIGGADEIVLFAEAGGILFQAFGKGMGEGAGEPVFLEFSFDPGEIKGEGAGELDAGIADLGDLFQRFRQALGGLAEIPQCEKLRTDFHARPSLWIRARSASTAAAKAASLEA